VVGKVREEALRTQTPAGRCVSIDLSSWRSSLLNGSGRNWSENLLERKSVQNKRKRDGVQPGTFRPIGGSTYPLPVEGQS